MNQETLDLHKASVTFMDSLEKQVGYLDPYRKENVRVGLYGLSFDISNILLCNIALRALHEASKHESEAMFEMLVKANYAVLESILIEHGKNLLNEYVWYNKQAMDHFLHYFPHVKLGIKLL